MLILWIKKLLGINSPTVGAIYGNMNNRGFVYAYDYAKALKAEQKFLKLNPDKVTISAQRLAELERLEREGLNRINLKAKEYKALEINQAYEVEREYYETFDKAEHYKIYIAEQLLKKMTPELLKHLEIVTDYNPRFMTYRTIGRLTILTNKEEA
jgi:hypothetical protein